MSILQSPDDDKPLRIFISGLGGTAKSYIIEILVLWNKIIRDKDTAVTASTGITAYNIQGLTLHRLLQLPVEQGSTAKYKELSNAAKKKIRQSLQHVNPLKTRQNLAEISRNELCHSLHNQKRKYPCFLFCRLQLFIINYLNK